MAERKLDLQACAERTGYSAEYLRKWMWREPASERPPLFKYHGKWHATVGELDRWLAERAGL